MKRVKIVRFEFRRFYKTSGNHPDHFHFICTYDPKQADRFQRLIVKYLGRNGFSLVTTWSDAHIVGIRVYNSTLIHKSLRRRIVNLAVMTKLSGN